MEMMRDMESQSIKRRLSSSCAETPLVFYTAGFLILGIFLKVR
jgi:hypothetical protein